ncbi:MAG: hypothetical protein LBG28_05275 [Tannerella sp.]|nr:hypothetical protein [Tannerella sp.]
MMFSFASNLDVALQRGYSSPCKEAIRRLAKRLFVARQRGCLPTGKEVRRSSTSNLDAGRRHSTISGRS